MIVVELAGASGVGKSTMASLLAEHLRHALGAEAVAALPENGVPRRLRRWTRVKRWSWTVLHPRALKAAWKVAGMEGCRTRFANWLRIVATMGIARKAIQQGVKVAVVDQGLLRLKLMPEQVGILPRMSMPDLVLHLVADPEVLELRRLKRQKKKCVKYQGDLRLTQGQKTMRCLSVGLSESQRREMIEQFGLKYCEPPFSEGEIDLLLHMELPGAREEATTVVSRCDPEICRMLQDLGVQWEKIDTTTQDLEQTAKNCVQKVLAALAPGPRLSQNR